MAITNYKRFTSVQFSDPRSGSPSVKFDIEPSTKVSLLDSNGNVTEQITGFQLWSAIKSLFSNLDQ